MVPIHPVILSGGNGSRLWPSSRKAMPKQFAPIMGSQSLFQQTLRRFSGARFERPVVMTHEDFRFLVRDQAADIGVVTSEIVLEPMQKDTAPAILVAALLLADQPDALMLITPSDHLVGNGDALVDAILAGAKAATKGHLVTFGIQPDRPEPGFGYLEVDAGEMCADSAVALHSFVEKPDAERAAAMIERGGHLWNAGIFLCRVRDLLAAFGNHVPQMVAPCKSALARARRDLGFLRLDADAYQSLHAESFDFAVMEKASGVMAVRADPGWSDMGSWRAVHDALADGDDGVAVSGAVTAIDCTDTLLRSEDPETHLVGLGLSNIVAVATRDAVLVASADQAQNVRRVVPMLRDRGVKQADASPRVHRPWGWFETLCLGSRFQVKRIMVRPGGILSLQSHLHRSEHWVVVQGTARVTIDGSQELVTENQSVYVPVGVSHRLENPGKVPMYLIEVQSGAYLGEDDISRHEDAYNRCPS